MKFVAFDLEIAKQIPSRYILTNTKTRERSPQFKSADEALHCKDQRVCSDDWRVDEVPDDFMAHWPLGISVAATCATVPDGSLFEPRLWYTFGDNGPESLRKNGAYTLLCYLENMANLGYKIVTWNGLRFDFHVLAETCGVYDRCADLARNHVDLMWLIFCHKGFYARLDNCAREMLGESKTEGIDGAKAPELWARGEHGAVFQYVQQDVELTAKLAVAVAQNREIAWTSSSSGKLHTVYVGPQLPTVAECLHIPEPDTSWMSGDVPTRDDFFAWMN